MSYELMFQKAVELHQNGALGEAEQIYRQILETAPNNADVLNLLGLIAQQRGFHQEAISYFYKAADNAPNHFPIFFNLAISLEALGRHLEALENYGKSLKLNPKSKEAHFKCGNVFWHIGNKDEAAKEYNLAIALDADYAEAYANLFEMNDDEVGLKKIADKYSDCPAIFYYLGRRKLLQKDYKNAEEYLRTANKLTDSDEIKTLLAEAILQNGGNQNEALTLFYQAERINAHNNQALLNIADILAQNQNFKEAEKYYKKAIEISPQNLSAHVNYADMLCKTKRTLEALEEYRQAVLIAPETPEISYNLALILKELQDYEQALYLMFNAFYLAPERLDWSINLAETLILFNKTAPEKAKKIAQNWYDKMPENVVACHLWAIINGQRSDHEVEYNRILFNVFAPTYEETLKNIDYQVAEKIALMCGDCKGKILDLGCGSGLLGAALKNDENEIFGVDISEKMLQAAEQKHSYAKLINAEICDFLQKNNEHFDLIVAADVFCYFGDLEEIFKLCLPMKLIFSVETDDNIDTFLIQPNGRYRHNPQYLKNLLEKIGYSKVSYNPEMLRNEDKKPVFGAIFIAEK